MFSSIIDTDVVLSSTCHADGALSSPAGVVQGSADVETEHVFSIRTTFCFTSDFFVQSTLFALRTKVDRSTFFGVFCVFRGRLLSSKRVGF